MPRLVSSVEEFVWILATERGRCCVKIQDKKKILRHSGTDEIIILVLSIHRCSYTVVEQKREDTDERMSFLLRGK